MKTTKLLTTTAVATALLPIASLAAIDDQGMQYVSAAEGLHGSLRVDILKNVDNGTDVTTGGAAESLRLWITGSGDIGNGWATTYYWEVRDGSQSRPGTIGTEAWTVGLKSPLGSFDFGRTAMVAPRMVPGGSLDTIYGATAAQFACDVCDNVLRFESATRNGFQVGASGVINGTEVTLTTTTGGVTMTTPEEDLFDEYSFAAKYTSPLGFQVGAGYEVIVMHDERFGTQAGAADYDDKSGWRLGIRYGQDNWLLGYEYRSYQGITPWATNINTAFGAQWIDAADSAAALTNSSASVTDRRPAGSSPLIIGDRVPFNSKFDYQVHRMGVQVKLDKITASAGYSLETQSLDVTGAADLNRSTFAVDAAYHLGLNSLLAVGWKKVSPAEQWARIPVTAALQTVRGHSNIGLAVDGPESTETKLYYRVDF